MSKLFENNDTSTALEAQYAAQKIAFAPTIFQVARSMINLGILEILYANDETGLSVDEISKLSDLSSYSIKVLLETSLSVDIVKVKNEKYFITKTGYFLLKDEMTKINMNYNHYVNYKGMYFLDEAIKKGEPVGLKTFGNWNTIYPALSSLPSKVKKSWFEFDHFYSDSAFNEAIDTVLKSNPKSILDIGGNTGKFSIGVAKANQDVNVTILDLPEQIELAKENIQKRGFDNIHFLAQDILDENKQIPSNFDVIWMSQFIDCFRSDDAIKLLKRVKNSMQKSSRVYIMEPLWDKQRFETSAFCIINTSPYFTSMANGYSKMLSSKDLKHYIKEAGLTIDKEIDNLGICQNIITCKI